MIIILMGVSGCGKTTVGQAMARRHGLRLLDGDDYHPPANVAKMSRGEPLTDADRWPWLATLNAMLRDHAAAGEDVALACSALRQVYRDKLSEGLGDAVRWVHLAADEAVIRQRLADGRPGHFMPPALLRSQIDTLEPPADALTVDVGQPADQVVTAIEHGLGLTGDTNRK